MDRLRNQIKAAALAVSNVEGRNRWGVVTNIRNTDTGYEVKLTLQPEDVLTGWFPVLSPMVGPGWGLVCPPVAGQQAFVVPDVGYGEHGVVVGLTFSTQNMPPQPGGNPVTPGQFALMHKNGSYLLFNDDDVTLLTNRDLNATVGRNMTAVVAQAASVSTNTGDISITAQQTNVNIKAAQHIGFSAPAISGDSDGLHGSARWDFYGDMFVHGQITDFHSALDSLRQHYNTHHHTDSHGDTTGTPISPD